MYHFSDLRKSIIVLFHYKINLISQITKSNNRALKPQVHWDLKGLAKMLFSRFDKKAEGLEQQLRCIFCIYLHFVPNLSVKIMFN